jgi:hypothetical protein
MNRYTGDGADSRAGFVPQIPEGSAVKIVGLGGVGGIVARYGAVFLGSLDRSLRLVLIDGDSFEPANTARMHFGTFGNKAAVLRDELLDRAGESSLAVMAVEEYVTDENLPRLVREGDTVILAVDNHATRKLVGEFCERFANICLISGGNDGVEALPGGPRMRGTYGNCQIYVRREGADLTPPLGHLHPEIRQPGDRLPTERDCTELAVSVPQILFANLMAAACILNALWLHVCGRLHYGELCFDIADGLMRPLPGVAGLRFTSTSPDSQ